LVVLEGVLLGGLAVGAVAVATFVLERKLPYRKMLIATGLLTAVLMIMVGKTVRVMQGVGWLPITPIDIDLPYWTGLWIGVFPTVETVLAQVGAAGFVIDVVAERIKHRPRPRGLPAVAPRSRIRETNIDVHSGREHSSRNLGVPRER
jgi:high-affinity iron transporter